MFSRNLSGLVFALSRTALNVAATISRCCCESWPTLLPCPPPPPIACDWAGL